MKRYVRGFKLWVWSLYKKIRIKQIEKIYINIKIYPEVLRIGPYEFTPLSFSVVNIGGEIVPTELVDLSTMKTPKEIFLSKDYFLEKDGDLWNYIWDVMGSEREYLGQEEILYLYQDKLNLSYLKYLVRNIAFDQTEANWKKFLKEGEI